MLRMMPFSCKTFAIALIPVQKFFHLFLKIQVKGSLSTVPYSISDSRRSTRFSSTLKVSSTACGVDISTPAAFSTWSG